MYDELIAKLRGAKKFFPGYLVTAKDFRYELMPQDLCETADAIEELSKLADAIPHVCECCVGCELEKKNGGCDHGFILSPKQAMQYLIKPRWIPVTEQLPNEEGSVLIFSKLGGIAEGHYSQIYGIWTQYRWNVKDSKVTHWMPLPEPPEEGEA